MNLTQRILGILLFSLAMLVGTLNAKPLPDFYFQDYEITNLDFLRAHYTEIEDGRHIRVDGWFSTYEWKKPFEYQARFKMIGIDTRDVNIVVMSLKEKEDLANYSFPVLIFRTQAGALNELKEIVKGQHLAIYGTYYQLKDSDYGIVVDVLEAIKKGGRQKDIAIDGRVSPTPTPTATPTPTPGPGLWKKIVTKMKPVETPTPTGTITPEVVK